MPTFVFNAVRKSRIARVVLFLAGVVLFQLIALTMHQREGAINNNAYFWGIYSQSALTLTISFGLVFCLCLLYARNKSVILLVSLAAACSNLLERLLYGGVADYIKIWLFYCNISDLVICLGVLSYFFISARDKKHPLEPTRHKKAF